MRRICFLILGLATILSACNNKKHAVVKVEEGWATFEEDDFLINYPLTWELNPSKEFGAEFMLISSLSSATDKFRENVTLIIQELLDDDMELDEFAKSSIEQINSFVTDAKIIENKRVEKKNKESYHSIMFTGKQGVFELKLKQYFWVIDNKAYVLTFSMKAEEGNEYEAIGEKILNSFLIK